MSFKRTFVNDEKPDRLSSLLAVKSAPQRVVGSLLDALFQTSS